MSDAREKILGMSTLLPSLSQLVDDDFNADEFIRHCVQQLAKQPPPWQVDSFQIEANFEDVGRLLERLIELRRDLWELSAIVQKTALQYLSTIEQVEADNVLQIAHASDAARQRVEDAARRRLESTRESVALLESRHGEPGNALNYTERLNKMQDVLSKDLESCYVRSRALQAEAQSRYALDLPMPDGSNELLYVDFVGAAFLDDWSAWHRQLARALELKQTVETVHEVIVSLGRHQLVESFDDTHGESEDTFVVSPDLAKALKSESGLVVDLGRFESPGPGLLIDRRVIPALCGTARIVGIQVLVETNPDAKASGWRFNVQVKVPMALNSVMLTAASSAGSAVWFTSPAIANRPAKGEWYFRMMSAVAENSTPEQGKRESWPITDVKLALRLSGA